MKETGEGAGHVCLAPRGRVDIFEGQCVYLLQRSGHIAVFFRSFEERSDRTAIESEP